MFNSNVIILFLRIIRFLRLLDLKINLFII